MLREMGPVGRAEFGILNFEPFFDLGLLCIVLSVFIWVAFEGYWSIFGPPGLESSKCRPLLDGGCFTIERQIEVGFQ